MLGGFLGVVTRLSIYGLKNYQNFTIDKSMIKKLYSKRAYPKNNKLYPDWEKYDLQEKQLEVKDTI